MIIIFPKGTTFNTQNFRPAAGILLKGTTFNTQNFRPAAGKGTTFTKVSDLSHKNTAVSETGVSDLSGCPT